MTDPAENKQLPEKSTRQSSLRSRLTLLILPLIVIPLILIGGGAYLRSRDLLKQQANSQMTSALQAQIESLQEWTLRRQASLYVGTVHEELGALLAEALQNPGEVSRSSIRAILDQLRYRKGEELFGDLCVLRVSEGTRVEEVLVSTNPDHEGRTFESFVALPSDQINTLPIYKVDDLEDNLAFISSAPIRLYDQEQVDALLVGINSGLRIGSLLETMQVYWEQRGIYRVERGNTMLLLDPDLIIQLPRYATEPTIQQRPEHPVFSTLRTERNDTLEYMSFDGEDVLGAYQWLPNWNLAVVIELPQELAFTGLDTLAPFSIALILGVTLLVILLIPVVARRSLKPLQTLTSFAEKVAAGDLSGRVSIESKDEIGSLAQSFNYMTNELSQLYQSLEERVMQRTNEIRFAAEVARDATAIQDIEKLLDEAVNLISERFGYYHTAVFLLDEDQEYARLRAASSEGGKRMLRRGHILPVGKTGIVGNVTDQGTMRVAQDVSQDIEYYANPDLPNTKSELSLPLTVSGNVIGALDVQSQQLNAFSEGDILILQIVADQLAVAIENARLLKRQITLADLRSKVIGLFNTLSQQTSYDALLEVIPNSIRDIFNLSRVTLGLVEGGEVVVRSVSSTKEATMPSPIDTAPIGEGVLGRTVAMKTPQRLTKQPIHELETQDPRTSGSQTILAIPLIIRDEVTGTLAIETGTRDDLTKDEIESLELIAAQTAISLENSQLLEEMQENLDQIDAIYRQQTADAWAQLLSQQATIGETIIEDGTPPAREGSEPTLATPIELRGQMIGSLDLQGIRTSDWSEEDQEILEAVADELASALEQARLIEEINRKVTQLQTAAEIARSASGFLELDTLLNRAVNLVYERFGFYHIAIYLLDKDRLIAALQEAAGEAAVPLKERQFQLLVGSKSVVGRVTATGEYYVANQVEVDPYYWANPLLPEAESELGIPLKISDNVIGALSVIHNRPLAFSEDDVSVLQILADQVAVAVQNVQLFEQTLQRAQREKSVVDITSQFRSERDLDKMLQSALLETKKTLGAQTARIQLVPQMPQRTSDPRRIQDPYHPPSPTDENEGTILDTNESD